MNNFINWCNENSGFITVFFSVTAAITSVVAIIVARRTAKLPYKKVALISGSTYAITDGSEYGVSIDFVNVGQVGIKVSMIGLLIDSKQYFNRYTIGDCQRIVLPSDEVSHRLSFSDIEYALKIAAPLKTEKVYVFAKDSQGKMYKKYYCRASYLYTHCFK